MRCNRGSPCSNCMRSRRGECIYENNHPEPSVPAQNSRRELVPRVADELPAASLPTPEDQPANVSHCGQPAIFATFSPSASTGPQSDLPELEALKNKVKLLEDQLSKSSAANSHPQVSTPNFETTSTQLAGTFHLHSQSQPGGLLAIPRAISHKTRLFGQSHFVTGLPLVSLAQLLFARELTGTASRYSGNYRQKYKRGLGSYQILPKVQNCW